MVRDGAVVVWEGKIKDHDVNGPAEYDAEYEPASLPAWKFHLRQMVIADDPTKYLEQFLEDDGTVET